MKAATVGQPVASASKIRVPVEPRQAGAADILGDKHTAHAEGRGLAHLRHGKMPCLVPGHGMRRKDLVRKGARHVAHRDLIGIERKLRRGAYGNIEHGGLEDRRIVKKSKAGDKAVSVRCNRFVLEA